MAGLFLASSVIIPGVASSTVVLEPPPKAQNSLQDDVYALAREYGQDPVLALAIIKCEGVRYGGKNNQNLDANGNVWSTDIGPWQINNFYHQARMKSLGLDIYNTQDNLRYGFMLMQEQGTIPWKASESCWKKSVV